jgi:hypothetical protein
MGYRRVTREDRLRIKDGLDAGLTNAEIADKLGFHRSTIGREIRRNKGGRGYRPKQAHRLASEREVKRVSAQRPSTSLSMKTAVRVESYGDTLGAPAGLERGAFPLKTGGERYKTPGQYRSDLKGQTADGVLVIGRGI